jgi:hypothetical protein
MLAHDSVPGGLLGPAINAYLEINPNGSGTAFGSVSIENFPAFQLDQIQNGRVTNLVNVGESNSFTFYGPGPDRWISFPSGESGGFVLYRVYDK